MFRSVTSFNSAGRLATFVATFGYIGYVPVAPGTAGSFGGLAVYGLVRLIDNDYLEVSLLMMVVVVGIWASSVTERRFNRTDPGLIVIDEVAGMLMTLLWIQVTWVGALVAFLAFRVFDIFKPFPARWAERLPEGWGVMTDDLVAAGYAHVSVLIFAWVMPGVIVS
jgi:phosphatidylglycerophosphatase A